jgi:hypothetical protein
MSGKRLRGAVRVIFNAGAAAAEPSPTHFEHAGKDCDFAALRFGMARRRGKIMVLPYRIE